MDEKQLEKIHLLRRNEPLFKHSTFRVGGNADFFYEAKTTDELSNIILAAEHDRISYRIIGRGTNILFRDEGYRGLIVKNLTSTLLFEGSKVVADSGVLLSQIVQQSVKNNLTGLEPLHGLPGSIGAAVWGNAGVPNCEISKFVDSIEVFSFTDGRQILLSSQIDFEYRATSLQKTSDVILKVNLYLSKGDFQKSKDAMILINKARLAKQPLGFTCGSFFKNPSADKSAGMLIDQCGLKGRRIGGAEISQKHANFFLNVNNASASDILALAKLAEEEVFKKFGINLEKEVKIV